MRAPAELEHFIRDTLGCGCPDEVFQAVAVGRGPLDAEGDELAWWIEVGGRLLIAVTEGSDPAVLAARLPEIYAAAALRRDTAGFNRFRLVVVDSGEEAGQLQRAFIPIGAEDDRLHLHVVNPTDLPPLAATTDTESP
ncbi:MAG: hypothetical protein DRR03_08720 [Gammaproteobacteria bacterium]|nr:MAG: hypothetical protein DRR03_08720 [Gammaproteobacteria bacterium]